MNSHPYQPYSSHLVDLARANRKNPTLAEQKVWSELLRNRQLLGYKFLRQKPIDGYILDFYCSALGLVIEIDGDSHTNREAYDTERTRILQAYGLYVIRYTNQEVLSNLESVHQHLITQITLRQQTLNASPDKGRLRGVA
ncbi:MAG: hypothetical protein RLZZ215_1987 [Pseudomonadota bacterium]|jgi:very-short-patch-repair endonuclease